MSQLGFDLDAIKFSTDEQTFRKAVDLYTNKKVTQVVCSTYSYSATVVGTHPYRVSLDSENKA